ncbi:hypothetical protein [Flavobacterium sp. 3HN19-14]|uniref:hypothetical protein n=1 Tax=Flavobacterium sp. 3HN19-14 TaxID=3448133 RepID=UPI003EE2D157
MRFRFSELGYGFNDLGHGYDDVIGAYKIYLDNITDPQHVWYLTALGGYTHESTSPEVEGQDPIDYELVDTWQEFASYYIHENHICPPPYMQDDEPIILPINPDNPCKIFNINVHDTYNAEAYAAYIQSLKDAFRLKYINEAMREVNEKYRLNYYDKEYQYTLYYYDQAGNLMQTVARRE